MPHGKEQPPAALILAAGASRRLGRPKQLLQYRGSPLLRRVVRLALVSGAAPVLVALDPAQALFISAISGLPAGCLPIPNASEGMGASLRAGVEAVRIFYPKAERLLILVCDQPLVGLKHIRALLASTPPAAAEYKGKLGVPAVFARSHFPALATLQGDRGARALLSTLSAAKVPMPEAAFDIDMPEDVAALDRKSRAKGRKQQPL